MKLRIWLVAVMAGAVLLQAGMVYAAKAEVIVKADNKSDFTAVVAAVQQQMVPGGRYEFVDSKDRAQIDASLGDMQALFDKYDTVAQMSPPARMQLFNDQETVNAVLARRDDKRLVCEHVAPMGSNIARTTCRTYREVQQQQRDGQHFLDTVRQVNNPSGQSLGGH